MNYELITAEDFAALPPDPEHKFVELEQICRRNMSSMISGNRSDDFDAVIRLQYMTIVAAAAQELGITGVEYPIHAEYPVNELGSFMLQAQGVATRIRLRAMGENAPYSVKLANRTRALIELQIRSLRDTISEAPLPEDRRKALLAKLDELSAELNSPRLSFAKTMQLLAYVGAAIGGTTAFVANASEAMANGPVAIAKIISLIGTDKVAEEEEASRLGTPPKSLPAPVAKKLPPPAFDSDLDEDVPF